MNFHQPHFVQNVRDSLGRTGNLDRSEGIFGNLRDSNQRIIGHVDGLGNILDSRSRQIGRVDGLGGISNSNILNRPSF